MDFRLEMDPAPQLILELPMGSLEHLLISFMDIKASQEEIRAVSAVPSAQDHHKSFGDEM
jgi:hypothetical protein